MDAACLRCAAWELQPGALALTRVVCCSRACVYVHACVHLCVLVHTCARQSFIEDEAKDIDGLEVAYVQGARPELVMHGKGDTEERVNIQSWKTEHIVEYLGEKLRPSA